MKTNLSKFFNRRNIIIAVVFLMMIAIAIFVSQNYFAPQTASQNIVTVRRGDLSASVNATGKVRSQKSVRLMLPVSGMVQSISKYEGDAVNPGDVILTVRADDALRRVRQAEINVQSRQLDLARAKSAPRDEDIEIARANVRKATLAAASAEDAYTKNPNSQNEAAREFARIDLEVARANFNRVTNGPAREEIEALQNSVAFAQMELEAARNVLNAARVTAPFTSTVTEILVRENEFTGGGHVATVSDLTALDILADVDEIDVANVAVGQSVEVRLDAFPGELLQGKLLRLFPAASTQRGTTVYPAIIEFDAKNLKVRVGMGANLKILTVEKKNVLIVPNRALKNVGTRKAVRVVAPGEPRDVIVEIGVTSGSETEIVSGLNEGDQILVQ
jgi:HlyD family secretion protein